MVLGVTAAVAASEELRAMALDSEKSAASKPVLEQSLKNLADQRTAEERRLKNWKKELDSNRKEDRKLHKLMDEGAAQQRGVSEKLALFDEYEDATQRVQAAKDAAGQAEERLSKLNGELTEIDQIGNEAALKDALRANRQQQRDTLNTLRETDRETGRAEASGESAKAADLEERGDGLASELEALQDQERASDRALWECQHAKTRRTELEAATKAAKQELDDVASGVKKAEGALKKAATNIEEGASRKKLEASLQKSQLESAKAEAKLEVLEESVEQLEDDCADAAETLKELDREKADFEEKLSKASDSEDHAKLFRKSAAAFKWLQTRLRESAAQHLSERILVFHKQLSGNSDEITGVSIDSANYQVHVKARGHKSEAPAHLFQGGGHRVLLGLAFKLALAEWMGNVPCLLLDEPTDGLDSNHLGTMLDALGDCPATQQVIMITHEPTLTTKEGNIGVERIEGYSTITQEAPV